MRNGLCGASIGTACRPEVSQLWSVFPWRLAMGLHFERQQLRAKRCGDTVWYSGSCAGEASLNGCARQVLSEDCLVLLKQVASSSISGVLSLLLAVLSPSR